MKNFCYPFRLMLLLSVTVSTGLSAGTPENDLKIFRKLSEKLQSVKTISYHYTREFTYPAEDYHSKSEGEMYVDFSKENDLAGFRYQYRDTTGFSVFNSTELFETSAEDRTIQIKNKVMPSDFEGLSALYNSIITLRNILPAVIGDQTIVKQVKDTLIGKKPFHVLNFQTQDRYPDYLGKRFTVTTEKITFYNKIIVDKKSFLPVSYIQLKKGSRDINRTDFSHIVLNPTEPKENSWYYSTYLKEYKEKKRESVKLIDAGQVAPDFSLVQNETGEKVSLQQFRGHPVLLEFWIRNCSYCIKAVPELNTLNTRYGVSGLKILAINTTDSQQAIHQFVARHKVNYDTVNGDTSVNENYGVSAFPQIILIDKQGIILYSGDLNIPVLDAMIGKNL
ncbi:MULTISPECIES: TlpA family protein disulfide reductase [Chryseobacterium]|uniref:Peroxiredoxin/outer membrane lipoprotein-sorting protein n=1 Tax=Chryseobacterium camelliae TaxID=1265445 RepID=A0ABU0TIH3_9FLAO|nr:MULTISPECIES: TlpA disulfide reductase family protein [Chryseobacterium]MDT3409350.1 peroxiredoxin/outer membrane lipoprotein-sorting protein [Pseudacidovorax intermedius]MDQ1096786.1 peroxiredoxin/outer membrane lipoprotein-sorting protein [Chryseobacterium camelliae]MDQ1100728.1 peroxiredoxin/outer membrane lipoprotein-sorting protein [Chryseobacterium sp. SORGH_AS_1048]MDR6088067.1 peroxiredoxin/outer membrane lipoprotein-sorting protein [Chryseobacterium sp. SORGH_AS_0909]MDR6132442.1 p